MRRIKPRSRPVKVTLRPKEIDFILDCCKRGYPAQQIVDLMAEKGIDINTRKVSTEVRKAREKRSDPRAINRNPNRGANMVRAA